MYIGRRNFCIHNENGVMSFLCNKGSGQPPHSDVTEYIHNT